MFSDQKDNKSLSKENKSGCNSTETVFQFLKKRWWLFAISIVVAVVSGFIYAKQQSPQYESRLTFSLDAGSSDGALSSAMNLAAQFGLGMGTGQSMFEGDNILEIMKSRRMIESVLLSSENFEDKPTTLVKFYIDNSKFKKTVKSKGRLRNIKFPPGIKKEKMSYLQDSLLYEVYQDIAKNYLSATRPDKKVGIYEVRMLSLNEKFTKVFTDRIVEATSNFYTEITGKKDKETLEILEQRVASLKGNASSSIESRAATQDANINPAFAQAQAPIIKQQFNIQSYGKAYEEMFKTLEMARYQYLKKIPLLQIIDKADYPMKKIKLSSLKAAFYFTIITVLLLAIVMIVVKNSKD